MPTDPFNYDPPEEVYHLACDGEGCPECNHSGIDPVKAQAYALAAAAQADAEYAAWLELKAYENDLAEYRKQMMEKEETPYDYVADDLAFDADRERRSK